MRFDLKLSERQTKFAREVGSIVLGVLIALGLGEIATDLRWRSDAEEARSAMLRDLALDAGVMHERQLATPCIERRLRDVDALIKQARRTGSLPTIGVIGRPPIRPVVTSAWDMALSSGVLPHLSRVEASGFSTNFDMIKELRVNMNRQSGLWARLSAMEDAAGPVSPEFLTELMFVSAELRRESSYVDLVAGQIVSTARVVGKLNYWMVLDRDSDDPTGVITNLRSRPLCKPLLVEGEPFASSAK